MPDRAVVFIDGNNWYHSLRACGVDLGRLSYASIARKLLGPRTLVGLRYYIGRVPQDYSAQLYADQRRFITQIEAEDSRFSAHFGRLEGRPAKDGAAKELLQYLGGLRERIDPKIRGELYEIARRHDSVRVMVEKAVDVMLAVNMVAMAQRDEYDTAYVLSADGDYTHAVKVAREMGKRVFAATAGPAAQLGAACNSLISLSAAWFGDCYRPDPPAPSQRPRRR